MNMFIYCFDSLLKEKLIKHGYKMMDKPNNQDYWVFLNNPNIMAFNFTDEEKGKIKMTNRLNF